MITFAHTFFCVLCCAVLRCAVLCCAALCCAALGCAVLCCAVLCCAVLCCAVLCKLWNICAGSVTAVEQLGHGGIATLRKLQEGDDLDASAAIASLTALTCMMTNASRQSSPVTTAVAIDMLQAAPYLTDLEQWLQWSTAIEPTLGPLHTFCEQHGMLHHSVFLAGYTRVIAKTHPMHVSGCKGVLAWSVHLVQQHVFTSQIQNGVALLLSGLICLSHTSG